jgi:hypothetical protein
MSEEMTLQTCTKSDSQWTQTVGVEAVDSGALHFYVHLHIYKDETTKKGPHARSSHDRSTLIGL